MSDRKQLPGRPYVFSRTFPNSGTRNRARPDPAKRLSVLARTAPRPTESLRNRRERQQARSSRQGNGERA